MKLAVPKEILEGERRVALVPESITKLKKAGYDVIVEAGAGETAGVSDDAYAAAGAVLEQDAARVFSEADFVLKVQPPIARADTGRHEAEMIKPGARLLTTLAALSNPEAVKKLAAAKVTAFSTDFIPRITRAQAMDTLSSMASIAGYKAVLIAANTSGKLFPMMMTAAGTLRPAKVFVMGAGVAGLQAIATARRLGAVVEATDVRPAVKEQVESLGAKFIAPELPKDAETAGGYAKEMTKDFLEKQRALNHETVKSCDVVITTAQVFGRKAPILMTDAMVQDMPLGSVIVDLAAEQGGNCEGTEAGQTIVRHGVTIVGAVNLPSTMPVHASQMYSRNLATFLLEFTKDKTFVLNLEDEIIKGCLVTHDGKIVNELTKQAIGG